MALKSILVKPRGLSTSRLECSVCKERFWMTCKYLDHMAIHKNFILSCNICNKGFHDQKLLDEHYLTHTGVINTYDCKKCTRKFLQKYQLEQHMEFHNLSASTESPAKKRKSVHFNNVLEMKRIDDDYSDEDEDEFFEKFKTPNRTIKTRCGRIVKRKKLFDEDPEIKYRKSKRTCVKEFDPTDYHNEPTLSFRISKEENAKQSVTKEDDHRSIVSPVKKQNIPSTKHINQKSEQFTILKKNLSAKELVTTENSNQTIIAKESSKIVIDKELHVVVEKIPDFVYEEHAKKLNICTSKNANNSESNITNNQSSTDLVSAANIKNNFNTNAPKCSEEDSIQPLVVTQSPIKKLDVSITGVACKSTVPKVSELNKSNKLTVGNKSVVASEIPRVCSNCPSTSGKQFLYVGPNPDINKIKEIIKEMNSLPKDDSSSIEKRSKVNSNNAGISNFQNSNRNVSSNVSPISVSTVKSLNFGAKDDLSYTRISPLKHEIKHNDHKFNENLPVGFKDGILEKKVVRNFVFIKVTPEYMQKIQNNALELPKRQNLDLQTKNASEIKAKNAVTCSNINSIVSSVSKQTGERRLYKNQSCSLASNKQPSVIGDTHTSYEFNKSDKIKTYEGKYNSTQLQKAPEFPNTNEETQPVPVQSVPNMEEENSIQCELNESLSKKEKLLERYRAKLQEKEMKKKSEYEFKKKLRYLEKLLSNKDSNYSDSVEGNSSKESLLIYPEISINDIIKITEKHAKVSALTRSEKLQSPKSNNITKTTKNVCTTRKSCNKDPYSDASIISTTDTFTIQCPCNSKKCAGSSSHQHNADVSLTNPVPEINSELEKTED